jgi:Reverse transcriptase (RNA-dependent DNA polymerase)
MGFTHCDVDQAMFFRRNRHSLVIVVVHVDDCTIGATSLPLIFGFKSEIRKHVEITDLGELHYLLGIEIIRDHEARTIAMSQHAYIDLVKRADASAA